MAAAAGGALFATAAWMRQYGTTIAREERTFRHEWSTVYVPSVAGASLLCTSASVAHAFHASRNASGSYEQALRTALMLRAKSFAKGAIPVAVAPLVCAVGAWAVINFVMKN